MRENGKTQTGLSIFRKIGYAFGEAGSQLSWTLISSYLIVFYTDVVGLTPLIISVIMLAARVWDAVNDPMFGSIAENTRSRWGRFRPYILFGSPFLALFNCLTFLNLDIPNTWKSIWCAVTYIGCGMAYTVVNISCGSMVNSLTANNVERVSLNACRGVVGSLTGMFMSAVTMPVILYFGGGSASSGKGYFIAALIFSILSLPCFFICVASTKEIIGGGSLKEETGVVMKKSGAVKNLISSLMATLKDRDARLVIIAMLLFLTGFFGRMGIMAYYFIYVLNDPAIIAICATALVGGMMVPNFYCPFLMKRINKKTCGVLSCICQVLCCTAFFFAAEMKMTGVITVISFLYGATHLGGLVAFGLGGEIIDDNWLKNGKRSDGVIYSSFSFATKLGNAIGGSVGIAVLGAVGFVANTQMSAGVLTKINMVINFGPALAFLFAVIPFAMIRMTNQKGKENEEKLRTMIRQRISAS